MKLFRSDTFRKGIIYSTGFNLFAKIIAFFNSIVIAFYFGTQVKTDIYFYSIATISLLIVFVTSLNHSVIIPESIRIREQESELKSKQFLTFFLYIYLLVGVLAIGILYINPVSAFSFVSKFNVSVLTENIELLYWVIPLTVLMIVTTYLTDILASFKYFIMPMVASSINSIFSLVFVIIFHNKLDIKSILFGLNVGYLINILLLIFILRFRLNWIFKYERVFLKRKIIFNMLFAQAGNVCTLMASYIPLYLLSGINKGIITSLNYGKNVSEIPNQMITNQFSVVSGIKYNELVAKGEIDKLNEVFLKTSKFLLFILFAISGLFFLYSEDIIKIVFMRGAFNMKSVSDTALFLKYFGILIPFSAFNTIGAKIFMAMQKIKHAFVYQIITNILLVIFIYLFVNFYGAIGYPIALILIYALSVITIQPLLKITLPTLKYKKLLYFFIKIIIINFLIVIFLYKIGSYININSFARFFLGSFVYCLLLVLINEQFSILEQLKINRIFRFRI